MKYLMITLHDNDFYNELDWLGKLLLNRLSNNYLEFDINKIDFKKFKQLCVDFIAVAYNLNSNWWYKNIDYIEQHLESINEYCERKLSISIIDQTEIKEDNYEMLYVPLCTEEEINHGVSYFII